MSQAASDVPSHMIAAEEAQSAPTMRPSTTYPACKRSEQLTVRTEAGICHGMEKDAAGS